jgi:hypothetical protein
MIKPRRDLSASSSYEIRNFPELFWNELFATFPMRERGEGQEKEVEIKEVTKREKSLFRLFSGSITKST